MQTALSLRIIGEIRTNYGEFEFFQEAKEMGVQGIPELICGEDIENNVVEIDKITTY